MGSCVALGYFDGVHRGHRRILQAACELAAAEGLESAAFTFRFSARRTKGADILTLTERERRIASLGVRTVDCEEFDDIAALSPDEFVRKVLCGHLEARAVFCGENFRFGAGAAGDVATLRTLCEKEGVRVFAFPLETADGQPVSSTRIRALLAKGELSQANELLGEPYAIDLPVVHGQQLGTGLGFPTINQVYAPTMQLPKEGVYLTRTVVDGREYPSATGLGRRPTVGGESVTCETYLCGFQGDLYGRQPRVEFLRYLEPVRRFDSLEELKACILDAAQKSRLLTPVR